MKYLESFSLFGKRYGLQLFGSVFGKRPFFEPDNTEEIKIRKGIKDYTSAIGNYGIRLKPEFVEMMKSLKSEMENYPEILVPENTLVYRGINVKVGDLLKIWDSEISKYINKFDKNVKNSFLRTYKPKSELQSWTDNLDVANSFAGTSSQKKSDLEKIGQIIYNSIENGLSNDEIVEKLNDEIIGIGDVLDYRVGLIYKTKTDKNFLFKSKYFNKLSDRDGEDEILRVSNDPIECECMTSDEYLLGYTLPFLMENIDKIQKIKQ